MAKDLLSGLNISDSDLRRIIVEVFEQKFAYMSKMSFLRWINSRQLSERIQKLTVEMMTEEDKKEHSNWSGYYIDDGVHLRDKQINEKTLDHELNHFLNDNTKQFPRYINEGLTEFLTQETFKSAGKQTKYVSYSTNVDMVKFLYSIFGDELIKCYLVGVSDEFSTKLERFLTTTKEDSLQDFYSVLEELHWYYHPINEEDRIKQESKKERVETKLEPKRTHYLENILLNSIINDMLDFKFYKDSKIDITLLANTIYERLQLQARAANVSYPAKEGLNKVRELLSISLCHSYLINFYTKEEIVEQVNKAVTLGTNGIINVRKNTLEELNNKTKDVDYYALKSRIDYYDYYTNNGFDYETFILDYFTLISTQKFPIDTLDIERNLYSFLYKKIKGNVDVDLINTLIEKYGKFYSHIGTINNENIAHTKESSIVEFTIYDDLKMYLEKRDNEYYCIIHNVEKNEVESFPVYPKERRDQEYPYYISFYHQDTKRTWSLLLNEDQNIVCFNNKEIPFKKGLKNLISATIIAETRMNYREYIHYLNDGENLFSVPGTMYAGVNLDEADHRTRFIDYESFLDDLREKIKFLPTSNKKTIIEENITNCLRTCYGGMQIPQNIIAKAILLAKNYIEKNEDLNKLKRINVDLKEEWKKYISELTYTGALYFRTKEDSEKYFKITNRRKVVKKAREEVQANYESFILEPNELYFDNTIFTHGLEGVSFASIELREYSYPHAKKIDFPKLIAYLKEVVAKETTDPKHAFNNYYCQLSYFLLGISRQTSIVEDQIREEIEECVFEGKEPNIELLESLEEENNNKFQERRKIILEQMKNDSLKINTPHPEITKEFIKKIRTIEEDELLPEELKQKQIVMILELYKSIGDNNKYEQEIYAMDEVIAQDKKKKSK